LHNIQEIPQLLPPYCRREGDIWNRTCATTEAYELRGQGQLVFENDLINFNVPFGPYLRCSQVLYDVRVMLQKRNFLSFARGFPSATTHHRVVEFAIFKSSTACFQPSRPCWAHPCIMCSFSLISASSKKLNVIVIMSLALVNQPLQQCP
jgi:hypothetical protein